MRWLDRAHNVSSMDPLLGDCRYGEHVTQLLDFLYGGMQEGFLLHHDQQVILVEENGKLQFF